MKECSCERCSNACSCRPGWFKPGEIETAAKLLKMSVLDFFRQKLAVDWWEGYGDEGTVFVIAPAIKGKATGEEYHGDPRGECIFYKDGKCEIHAAKPFECAAYFHNDSHYIAYERHRQVANAWKKEQEKIEHLLGRQPVKKEFVGGGLFSGLFGGWD